VGGPELSLLPGVRDSGYCPFRQLPECLGLLPHLFSHPDACRTCMQSSPPSELRRFPSARYSMIVPKSSGRAQRECSMEARLHVRIDPDISNKRTHSMQHTLPWRGWRAPPPPLHKLCQTLPLAWAGCGQHFHGLLPGPVCDQTARHNKRRDHDACWYAAQLFLQVSWLPERPHTAFPAVGGAR
jgi:hypothetical protein